jgi:tetratricopeptide (TPR) repeat protein
MLNIAATHIRQGSLDEAIEIYQKILKTESNNEEVKTALTRAYAMFAGVNPDTAMTRKSSVAQAKSAAGTEPTAGDEHRVQREARERAQREAQVRSQRPQATEPAAPKGSLKEQDLLSTASDLKEDEIAGDHHDEFMTVTVAEIYTKQGLLNEALKIYQKILEIEPGSLEAQVKKQELEATMAEQERLRKQSEETARAKQAKAASQAAAPPPGKPDVKKGNDDQEPPPKGKRGRVSYV